MGLFGCTYPEYGKRGIWHYHTAETDQTSTKDHGVHDCSKVFIRGVGCDGLAD